MECGSGFIERLRERVGNSGNWEWGYEDTSHHDAALFYSVLRAGPYKFHPEDGLPASNDNNPIIMIINNQQCFDILRKEVYNTMQFIQ